MKIFLTTKRGLITYVSLFMLAICMLFTGGYESVGVNTTPRDKKIPIYCTDRGEEKICTLTFDAAWDDSDTDRLIAVLERYNAKATFFVVGEWAEKYSESVKKLYEAGHEIANHSDTHPHINNLTEQKITEEIEKCGEKIERITKTKPVLFRGPYGEYNNMVIETAEKLGYKTLQWDVDPLATVGKLVYERGWRG